MDDGLKQRLIGAFVLLALAVIFIPVMFDRERMVPVDTKTQIPAAPHIEPVIIETPLPAPVVDAVPVGQSDSAEIVEKDAPKGEDMYVPDESVEVSLAPEPISVDPQGVPNSWVLQVASFKDKAHANEFRDTLIKAEYSAYSRTVNTSKGIMTRVYVGPKIDKEILLEEKKQIEKKYKVSTLLLKFKP
ncbi:Cell division protein DedD [Thalassocella blandensis]|nr:Cell division protein DedD [Thalassocella blandensis]